MTPALSIADCVAGQWSVTPLALTGHMPCHARADFTRHGRHQQTQSHHKRATKSLRGPDTLTPESGLPPTCRVALSLSVSQFPINRERRDALSQMWDN